MEHLEFHPFAFLDENNIVISVLTFSDHNQELLNQVKESFNFANFISCCEYGIAVVNGDFYNEKFYEPKPFSSWIRNEELGIWEAPIPYPTIEEGSDEVYIWDEPSTSWLLLPPSN